MTNSTGPQLHDRGKFQIGREHSSPSRQSVRGRSGHQGSLPAAPARRLPGQRRQVSSSGRSGVPVPGHSAGSDFLPESEGRRRVAACGSRDCRQ